MKIVIVGGGVLGTMHAWEAVARGHSVVQLERDAEARSASVRNFGLVWVSGRRGGHELRLALRARVRWEAIGKAVPDVGFRSNGSLTLARNERELEVMREYAGSDDAAERDTTLVDRVTVASLNPAVSGRVLGGLHCRLDAAVEPRVALPALRAAMLEAGRYRFVAHRRAATVDDTGVIDHTGDRHVADHVVVCAGAIHDDVLGRHLSGAPLRRCQLQMMQTAPLGDVLATSVADADSMRYYPAFAGADLDSLDAQPPVAAAGRMQLLMVQRLDGGLTIGDTHAYDEPFPFDVDEAPYDHLAARAEELLGRPLPPVQRRWYGVYSEIDPAGGLDDVYYRANVDGVVAVTGLGGRGMTLSPAIAEETAEREGW